MSRSLYILGIGGICSLGSSRSEILHRFRSGDTTSLFVPKFLKNHQILTAPISAHAEESLHQRIADYPNLGDRDRVVQLAVYAALEALEEFVLNLSEEFNGRQLSPLEMLKGLRIGVLCGSARGATATLEREHGSSLLQKGVAVTTSPATTAGVIASSVAQIIGVEGIEVDTSMTCTSGFHALLVARALVLSNDIDLALVVGSEAPITPFTLDQLAALRISPRKINGDRYPCRPFSGEQPLVSRMVLGEGAGAIVVVGERFTDRTKGHLGVIKGIGFASEAPPTLTGIGEEGGNFQSSMVRSFKDSVFDRDESLSLGSATPLVEMSSFQHLLSSIDAVICHAPGTIKGDLAELNALNAVFGHNLPPIFTTKWLTGHTYGASGLLSLYLATLMLQGLRPKCPDYQSSVPLGFKKEGIERKGIAVQRILINAAGFGGNAISVLISKH